MNYFQTMHNRELYRRIFLAVWFVLLGAGLTVALAHPVDLASADLGRHLVNGRQAVQWLFSGGSSQFLHQNTYSYTAPTFAVPNHHWASGMLFWMLYAVTGFTGLSVGYIALVLCGLLAAVWLAVRAGGVAATLAVLPLCIPLVAYRAEVRPEVFSFVFVPVVALICVRLTQSARRWGWIVALLLLQVVWVNMHIYFILGPAVVGAFLVDALLRRNTRAAAVLWWCIVGQVAVSALNPNGLWGVWYPFTIFGNYGYRVLENQTVWFLWRYGIHTAAFWVFGVLAGLTVLAGVVTLVRWRTVPVWTVCLALGGIGMGLFAVRNLALTAVLVLPLCAWAVREGVEYLHRRWRSQVFPVWLLLGLLTTATAFFALYPTEWHVVHGLGVQPGTVGVSAFLRQAHITGPVYNNYDVGGLLIFGGFPEQRVFVDNRPEAYPAGFFSDVYIPMQEDATAFKRVDTQYGFEAVVFNYKDATPWAQTFLRTVLQDVRWVPVYVDQAVLVLIRDTPEHAAVVQRYALPRELFTFRSPQ